ncbi:hypothetical protein ABIB40_003057 [Pedobacter sp. UYP30]|uniref:hypothetical protein n=1 Tax=Pedobacter sp. UYP30 TaxID=1756400 RepID=UPI003395E9C7
MVNKGKIIFVNGYWQDTWIGREFIGSSKPNKAYWNGGDFNGFARAAQHFFGLNGNINQTCICLDASSLIVLDDSGGSRVERGYNDYATYEWAGKMYKRISDKYGYGLPETSGLRNKILAAEINKKRLASLTLGMDKGKDAFYLVGHSEGCAYAAGLAKLLKEKGWKVNFIVYLSSFDSASFDSPKGIKAYQLGYTGKYGGDWATNNNAIHSGIERSAIVYKNWGYTEKYKSLKEEWNHFKDDLKYAHGSTKGEGVWTDLTDLKTLMLRTGKDYGYSWQEQIAASTPNHTVFAWYNGIKLNYKEYMNDENAKYNQYNYKTQHYYR